MCFKAPRQLKAILWKNVLLKYAHKWSTSAEILLPVLFMAMLILIKLVSTIYDSPDIAYSCGNTYPWNYNAAVDNTPYDQQIPFTCLEKPSQCFTDNYYRDSFVYNQNGDTTVYGYNNLGYVDSATSTGFSSNPFYCEYVSTKMLTHLPSII